MNKENLLKTRKQRYAEKRWDKMFVSRKMLTSKAYFDMKTTAAFKVFAIFINKCIPKKVKTKPMRNEKDWIILNNGEIEFTYIEAWEKWGIKEGAFRRALDENIRVGLIDITKQGNGLQGDKSLFAISNRWEKFGTDEFIVKKRPKRKQQYGFTNKNKYGRNCMK